MSYSLLRPLLFCLDPECAHALTLTTFKMAERSGLLSLMTGPVLSTESVRLMGLRFPSRVGIAAGLDKNGVCVDAWHALGAGFVEVGTVTPQPQTGNPRPRVFRLTAKRALINRMGFPNAGAAALCQRLQQRRRQGVCGINIGKNASTPLERASDDYLTCLRVVAPHADYITINVSSPNTAGLRSLQAVDQLRPILETLLEERIRIVASLGRALPLLVKLAPDLGDEDLKSIADLLKSLRLDGVIATNTTLQRPGELGPLAAQAGGLSGEPLRPLSVEVVRKLRGWLGPQFPIVGVGGIASAEDALAMRAAGADLVQIYSGLIYRGPRLIREVGGVLA